MTGRGTNTAKKRHSSQPLGGDAKDARAEAEAEAEGGSGTNILDTSTWSQVLAKGRGRFEHGGLPTANRYGLLAQANSYPDRTMRSASVSSRGSRRGSVVTRIDTENAQNGAEQELTYSESSLGAASRYVTPPPDGAYRDDFAIEFQQVNGKPFRGSITLKEARDTVFRDTLGFRPSLLHSIRPVFGGVTTMRFKLKEQINMDDLANVEYFELPRVVNPTRTDVISCRIMGIRGMQAAPNYDGTANDVRWVKIENCEYMVEQEQIVQWMELFGQPLSLLGEDVLPDSDSEGGALGNGTYSIKMKLERDIPQFLPMHGRKIRVYFKNMNKLCTNCYGSHTRRQCTNEKVPWITYVRDFMKNNQDITEDYYGKWWEAVDNEYPGYFDDLTQGELTNAQQNQNQESERTSSTMLNTQNDSQMSSSNQLPSSTLSFRNLTAGPSRHHDKPRSRDPRLHKQQDDQDELSRIMSRGLSLNDAKNYIKNKKEQEHLEKLMQNRNPDESRQQGERHTITKLGPGSSRGGRGGLSFN